MQLERRFVREDATAKKVHEGILALAPTAERLGSTHPGRARLRWARCTPTPSATCARA